jgi:hypothetical protein
MWSQEFLARHCPTAARIEWRRGSIPHGALDLCNEEAVDLIVLSWSQDTSPGHAAVVRELLATAPVPVMLLPVAPGS